MKLFIHWSARLGSNIIDWIRSIHFSITFGSILTLIARASGMAWDAIIVSLIGVICAFLGLVVTAIITNRFKHLEKDYDKDTSINKDKVSLRSFYYTKELQVANSGFQHFVQYFIMIVSFLLWLKSYNMSKHEQDSLEVSSMKKELKLRDGYLKNVRDSLLIIKIR
ncbi:hypothetical protein [Pedobacter deserti]|uniref:hypothetical protein n=1 Tax=Pedobacter deserti TaxID=2817382 RepID=UPI00210A03B7|nr:hypothetical protein [Pedobacter sp. SYSU D00382]